MKAYRLTLLICLLMALSGASTGYAQEDEPRVRPSIDASQYSANEQGVLNAVHWDESELVIDGKTYRFNPETLNVFYLNQSWSLISVRSNARIEFQTVGDNYVVAIWVNRSRDVLAG